MTRPAKYNVRCHVCRKELVCNNEECKNYGESQKHGTLFSLWLRDEERLKSEYGYVTTNLDFIWRDYKKNWLILIEEKIQNGDVTKVQEKTFFILDKALQLWSMISLKFNLPGKIKYNGFYLIQFENESPDDSEWIKINGKKYDKSHLLFLLHNGTLEMVEECFKDEIIKKIYS